MTSAARPLIGRLGFQVRQQSRSLLSHGPQRGLASIQPQTRYLRLGVASTPRTLSTSQHSRRPDFSKPLQARISPSIAFIGILLVGGGAGYYFTAAPSRPDTLNDRFFVPYTVTAREAISPSSFVITVIPHTPNPSYLYLNYPADASAASLEEAPAPRWRFPLWSVEFKQPEVQIARHYTPLPPLAGEDPANGALRFYIRTVGDGEMSHYLARRRVGQDVHLRGPHAGFELAERLGARSRVVFLAGGTGVVPGMQAAKAVLDADPAATVHLLWAVRKREEIQASAAPAAGSSPSWKFWQGEKQPAELGAVIPSPSPVSQHLNHLKAVYGDRLKVQVAIDEEGTRFKDQHIKNALAAAHGSESPSLAVRPPAAGCRLHDQTMHVGATEFAAPEAPGCVCPTSETSKPGSNLFIVSGPDGFIEHYAGQKIWYGGHQTQGPVGGVIGQLQRQEPRLGKEWLVLKM